MTLTNRNPTPAPEIEVLAADPASNPPLNPAWNDDMEVAPKDGSSIFLTGDPWAEPDGTLSYWRTTREKMIGTKGWKPRSFWASVLTSRALEFEPLFWRESVARRAVE